MLEKLVLSPDDKPNLFNNFFGSIFLSTDQVILPTGMPDGTRTGTARPRVREDLVREFLVGHVQISRS